MGICEMDTTQNSAPLHKCPTIRQPYVFAALMFCESTLLKSFAGPFFLIFNLRFCSGSKVEFYGVAVAQTFSVASTAEYL